jgi:hypothetical protein
VFMELDFNNLHISLQAFQREIAFLAQSNYP